MTDKKKAANKKWEDKNPEKMKAKWRRSNLKRNYGLTVKQHKQMYIDQNGCCSICGKAIPYDKIDTDHNHVTNVLRDLLCHKCNLLLAYALDDTDILYSAIKYLVKHDDN